MALYLEDSPSDLSSSRRSGMAPIKLAGLRPARLQRSTTLPSQESCLTCTD